MDRTLQILEESGAIIRGDHFVHVTGEHGDGWIDKDAIFPHTDRSSELCRSGIPVNTRYAHGADFRAAQAAKPAAE